MRYPAAETAEKHRLILREASRLFREKGFTGVSVSEIMKATGLTHGPFYNHFESKEALMAGSMDCRADESVEEMEAVCQLPDGAMTYIDGYLSEAHRDSPGTGCLMAALASDASRERAVQPAFARLAESIASRFEKLMPWKRRDSARADSLALLASMVGAQVIARAVGDDPISREILEAVQGYARKVARI